MEGKSSDGQNQYKNDKTWDERRDFDSGLIAHPTVFLSLA